MKILVIGDFHGKFPSKLKKIAKSKEIDLILCTGDFGGSDKLLKVIFKYFYKKWWKKVGKKEARQYVLEDYNSGKRIIKELGLLGKPVFIIPGNWDFFSNTMSQRTGGIKLTLYSKLIKKFNNLKYWKRGIKSVKGLKIVAFGGSVTAGAYLEKGGYFKERKKKAFVNKNKEQTKQLMKYGAEKVDILLAHYPAFGYFDIVRFKGENPMNGKHVGFKGYTEYIKKFKPSLFLCGHMHEYQGIKKLGKTKIVSTGSAKEGKAVVIEIDEQKGKVKNIKFLR